MAGAHATGCLDCCGHIDADGATQKQALLPKQVVNRLQRVLIVDPDCIVHRSPLQIRSHAAIADALRDRVALAAEFAAGGPAVKGTAMGIRQDTAQLGLLLLQIQCHTGIGAAGARGSHPGIHLAAGLLPDLRTGGPVVGAAIGEVVEETG